MYSTEMILAMVVLFALIGAGRMKAISNESGVKEAISSFDGVVTTVAMLGVLGIWYASASESKMSFIVPAVGILALFLRGQVRSSVDFAWLKIFLPRWQQRYGWTASRWQKKIFDVQARLRLRHKGLERDEEELKRLLAEQFEKTQVGWVVTKGEVGERCFVLLEPVSSDEVTFPDLHIYDGRVRCDTTTQRKKIEEVFGSDAEDAVISAVDWRELKEVAISHACFLRRGHRAAFFWAMAPPGKNEPATN